MSQIFDSLRRSRKSDVGGAPTARTAHGDAVLATLGYAPSPSRKPYRSLVFSTAAILGLAGVGAIAWRVYFDHDGGPVATRRGMSPGMPKPAAPLARPPVASQPGPSSSPYAARDAERAGAQSTREMSNVGRRASPDSGLRAVAIAQPSRPKSYAADGEPRIAEPGAPISYLGARIADPGPRMPDPGPRITDHGTVASNAIPDGPSRENALALALSYHRAGDFANALRQYRAVIEQNELNAQAHNNLGLLYQERNRLQESAHELQRAVVIEPRNPSTRNNYGVTLLMLGQVEHAAAEFETALWLEPRNVDALVNLSLVQRKKEQPDIAKETLLRVLNIAPRNAAAHYNLAQLYDDTNERARAVEHYRLFLDNAGAEHADRAAAVRARIAALNTMSK